MTEMRNRGWGHVFSRFVPLAAAMLAMMVPAGWAQIQNIGQPVQPNSPYNQNRSPYNQNPYNQNRYPYNQNSSTGSRFGNNNSSGQRTERRTRTSRSSRGSANQREESATRTSEQTTRSRQRERRPPIRGGVNPFAPPDAVGEAPARARPQERSKVDRIGGGRRTSSQASVGEFPRFEISEVIQSETVYFLPPDMKVDLEERFSTPIVFYNPNGRQVDHIDFWVRYNPELIDPVWVDMRSLEPLLTEPLDPEVWRSKGFIHVSAKLKVPLTQMANALATINWRAIHPTQRTQIKLESPEGEMIGLYENGENVLESQIGNKGIVAMQLKIRDPNAEENTGIIEVASGEDPFLPTEREGRGVHLALVPKDEMVLPGEVSTVDISLISPDVVPFDELRVRIRFDPEAVEILDADEGNYITEGVNIYDGGFHESMPFEFHGKNWVDQGRGIIEYAVGSAAGLRSYPSGTVARIVFRMKRDAGSTIFWFEGLDPLSQEYVSDVRARGRSLLGPATGRGQEALHNALVEVAPIS